MQDTEIITADGEVVKASARSAGGLIDLLEDGSFSAELYEAMVELGQKIEEVAHASGGKAKGSMTLKIELVKEDGAFKISSDFTSKPPKMPRARSIMWTDEDGNFTRFPPGQRQMFGLKQADGPRQIREV